MSFSGATVVPKSMIDISDSNTRIAENNVADAAAHALCFDCWNPCQWLNLHLKPQSPAYQIYW